MRSLERAGERLASFPRFLRSNGFCVGTADATEVLRAAAAVGVLDPSLLRWSLKALLCGRCDEWRRFDALFDAWFLPANRWAAPERRSVDAHRSGQGALAQAAGRQSGEDRDTLRPRDLA
ncbi:MAG TPA: hypothetical protein VGD76_09890, partial [Ramlibacter sp.]